MNGDRAEKQLRRIKAMVEQSGSNCIIVANPGELDSVHLTFHCGEHPYSVPWVGAWLEKLSDDELWRELDLATRGSIKKPT